MKQVPPNIFHLYFHGSFPQVSHLGLQPVLNYQFSTVCSLQGYKQDPFKGSHKAKIHWPKPRSNDQGCIRTSEPVLPRGRACISEHSPSLDMDGWSQHSVTGHLPWHMANIKQAREPKSFLEEPGRFLPQEYILFVFSTSLGHQVGQRDTQKGVTGFRILWVKVDITTTLKSHSKFHQSSLQKALTSAAERTRKLKVIP